MDCLENAVAADDAVRSSEIVTRERFQEGRNESFGQKAAHLALCVSDVHAATWMADVFDGAAVPPIAVYQMLGNTVY